MLAADVVVGRQSFSKGNDRSRAGWEGVALTRPIKLEIPGLVVGSQA
jgi:hypothetical protein